YATIERAQKGGGDITQWIAWFLRAVILSIEESLNRIRGVIDREAFWASLEGVPLNSRQRNMLHRLKGDFEGKLTAAKWAKLEKVSGDTALRDINDLVSKGILERSSAGGRSTSYVVVSLK
ncbi:MAG: Fic family protein, partial [Eggerthellaceae bacterium]|nr:Fic family protein [Eggerthellaceae bacterium]